MSILTILGNKSVALPADHQTTGNWLAHKNEWDEEIEFDRAATIW